jgi:hypothetical protein
MNNPYHYRKTESCETCANQKGVLTEEIYDGGKKYITGVKMHCKVLDKDVICGMICDAYKPVPKFNYESESRTSHD